MSTAKDLKQPLLPLRGQPSGGSGSTALAAGLLSTAGLCCTAYLVSGVSQPLVMSAVKHAGLGDTSCQIYMLPYYVGMIACGALGPPLKEWKWKELGLHRCVITALLGAVAQNLNYAGNMHAGSSIFAVVYSSVTIWSAVFSRVFLNKVLTRDQWVGVWLVFIGLAMTGIGARSSGDHVFRGAVMILCGAGLHAMTHVMSEALSSSNYGKVHPAMNCCVQGITSTIVVGAWQLVYTMRSDVWESQVIAPAQAAGTSVTDAVILLAGVALGNLVHAGAFFFLLANIGAISASVLKGLQAVFVFGLSHLLFCGKDPAQCITQLKFASLVVVLGGVYLYQQATQKAKSGKK
mmetsp:Transcript_51494/g.122456  ORF Transcript_51494/g.122456 Transcript_51494/m.122456 type:complete len:348 (-) Transcript_51494:177-1220(-)|eukprot:CAMPEP_0178406888 /NCGR_PEP_ID=MMETSP0689_2-20121128/19142_1 /TAXON_ID=160604 /ORGANISM="Amphidinium massartii, Strain CS-259" /LENGTH=347 /DNA_ID=CAMNT_0020027939 /DNA_START=111 /DNA_END=1154 /DNA_ORIENTATION=+